MNRLLAEAVPVFALARTSLGYVLLDRIGLQEIAQRLSGKVEWGAPDLIGHLSRKTPPARRRAYGDLRRFARARCVTGRLTRMLTRHVPDGCVYLNIGHSNLRDEVFDAWRAVPGAQIAVFVHDTIPIDYPHYQRPGTPELFEAKLRRVSAHADLVIYNSHVTRSDAEKWFARFGRCPLGVVAHLGVAMPRPNPADLPENVDTSNPYFVTIGTIEPRKNHTLLLDVWDQFAAELPQDRIPRLVFVGSRGWANEDVFRRLDASVLTDHVIFERSGLSDGAMAALLAGSHGLLCPSHVEGFGLPPAEAAMLNVPVICRKLAVYEEFLEDIPVYVESDDVYLWKQSISRLMQNKKATHKRDSRADPQASFPTWDDHFNIVLKLT